MAFSNQEKINNSDKLPIQIVGTANDVPGTRWWYNESLGLLFITAPSKIWAEFDNIPGAATPALADAAVTANPTLLEKRIVHLTLDPTSNNRAWTARETYGDNNTPIYGDWVQPALIRDGGSPSPGYSIRLYNGDPAGAGIELPTTYLSGAGGAPSWQWNYSMGVLVVSTDQAAAYAAMDLWVEGYRYIGPTGGAASSSSLYTYSFTNQTIINVPHNLASQHLLLKIRDDGTNDYDITGLASTIVYTDANNVDITFASPTSGTVVIGKYESDTYLRTHLISDIHEHQHAFNKNHPWAIIDGVINHDLRYAPVYYQFVDADEDIVSWAAPKIGISTLVNGMTKKKIRTYDSSTLWQFVHDMDSQDPFVVCQNYDGMDITSMAISIQYNLNDILVQWPVAQEGRMIVGM